MNLKLEGKYECGKFKGEYDFEIPLNNNNIRYFRNIIINQIDQENLKEIGNGIDEVNERTVNEFGIGIKSRQIRNINKSTLKEMARQNQQKLVI